MWQSADPALPGLRDFGRVLCDSKDQRVDLSIPLSDKQTDRRTKDVSGKTVLDIVCDSDRQTEGIIILTEKKQDNLTLIPKKTVTENIYCDFSYFKNDARTDVRTDGCVLLYKCYQIIR